MLINSVYESYGSQSYLLRLVVRCREGLALTVNRQHQTDNLAIEIIFHLVKKLSTPLNSFFPVKSSLLRVPSPHKYVH